MQEFGQFEVIREVATEANTIVYLARKKERPQNQLFAIKLFRSQDGSELPDHRESRAGLSVETLRKEILKAITAQKKAAERAPRCIAPIFDSGADARGVWYVTEYYPQGTLQKRIALGSGINAAELQYIVESVLAGLIAFKKRCGRSHGNLRAGNIFLRGEAGAPLQRLRVFLDQPCRGSEGRAGQFELDDIGALGQIIYQLVCQPQAGELGEIIFPIFGSEAWTKLGRDGEYWRELCNELLDPALSLETMTLGRLAAQLRGKRRRVARVLSAAVIVLVGATGLLALRDSGKDSRQAEVLIKAAQTAPSENVPPPQITKAKPAMAKVSNTNRPPSVTEIEGQTTEQDDRSLRATNSFLLTVKAGNTPPIISRIEDQTIAQDKSIELVFSLNDKETAPERLSVTKGSSNSILIPESNIELTARGTNGRVRISPAKGQTGESTIRLTVSDGDAETSTEFVVRVSPSNTPPTISEIEDQTTEQNRPIELTFTVGDKETLARDLILTKMSSNPSLVPEQNILLGRADTSGVLRITPMADQSGSSRITLVVTDGSLSATNSFLLTVKAGNTPPTISDIADQVTEENKTIELTFTVGDKETPAPDLILTKISSDPSLVPERNILIGRSGAAAALRIAPAANQSGTSRITLIVSDGSFRATNSFLLTVKAADLRPDIPTLANQITITDQNKLIEPIVSRVRDEEKETGHVELVGEPVKTPPLAASSLNTLGTVAERALALDPVPTQPNEARTEPLATDGALIATPTLRLPIRSKNAPPMISQIEDQSTEQDRPVELAFSISDKDTPVRRLRITKSSSNPLLVPAENLVLSGSGERRTLRIIPADQQTGTAEITVSVHDGSTRVGTSFQLEVTPRHQPAVVSTMTNSIGMEFVKVGPYWIGKYEVTRIEYEQLSPLDRADLRAKEEPAQVTWNDAMTFCGQLTFAEQEARSPLGKGWIYTLLTTNEWRAIMVAENFASLGLHRKAGANTPASVREWSFSADEDLRAPASIVRFNQEGDRIRIDEFGEDEKDADHTFRCVLVPRGELLASREVGAAPQKRRKREASKTDGWQELFRARTQKKF
jgi:hypothetical protein